MSEAKKILEMIEEVDPSDTDKMDEIDARVWAYKKNVEKRLADIGLLLADQSAPRYTRSRDALKNIRPEGWEIAVHQHCSDEFTVFLDNDKYTTSSHSLPTEELAELHAIIQAIEWERTQ